MRWQIVVLLATFSLISYVLRMNISIASKFLILEFGLTQVQIGQIFASFMLGYALFQLPAGILGDRWGPRRVLTLAALWWGTMTILTASAPGIGTRVGVGVFASLILVRFLLGVGEAATYPVATRAVANWVPTSDRALTNALVIAGATLGSAATPPIISWLMVRHGWRASFHITGTAAFFLALVWWFRSKDTPDGNHQTGRRDQNSTESKNAIMSPAGNGWTRILRRKALWILAVSYMFDSYLLFIFIFWLYTYLTDVRGFSVLRGGLFTSLPFLVATIMTPFGGHVCDRFCFRFGARRGRRIAPVGCLLLSGVFVFCGANVANPYVAIAVLSLSVGFIESTEGAYWSTSTDIGRSYAGAAGGVMNMFGNLGGVFSTAIVPIFVKHFGWPTALGSGTVAALIAGLLWFLVQVEGEG